MSEHLNLDLIKNAKEYAICVHTKANQLYGDLPYQVHLEGVVNNVIKFIDYIHPHYQDDVICAGWCHDIFEDTGESFNNIKSVIGISAARIVFNVTDEIGTSRKEKALKTYVKTMNDPLAKYVKLCDRIANVTNSKNNKHSMFDKYKKEHVLFKYVFYEKGQYEDMWNELEKLFNEKR